MPRFNFSSSCTADTKLTKTLVMKTNKNLNHVGNVPLNLIRLSESSPSVCVRSGFGSPTCFDPSPSLCFFFFFHQTERRSVADVRGGFANSASSPMRQYPSPPTPPSFTLPYAHTTIQMHNVPAKLNSLLPLFSTFFD